MVDTPSKAELFELPKHDIRFVFNAKNATSDASDLPDSYDGTRPVPEFHSHRFVHSPRGDIEQASWEAQYRRVKQMQEVCQNR